MSAPTPPTDVPDYALQGLDARTPQELKAIARYCEDLADYKVLQAERSDDDDDDRDLTEDEQEAWDELDKSNDPQDYDLLDAYDEDEQDDVDVNEIAGRAYKVTKTIDGDDYFYWQWRSDPSKDAPDKSKYIAPVNPKGGARDD